MPTDETVEEHYRLSAEEASQVERDRANTDRRVGGLFRGCFARRHGGLVAIRDPEDGVDRCPLCNWEIESGFCGRCEAGFDTDGRMVVDYDGSLGYGTDYEMYGSYDFSSDEELDDDIDLEDDGVVMGLDTSRVVTGNTGGWPMALGLDENLHVLTVGSGGRISSGSEGVTPIHNPHSIGMVAIDGQSTHQRHHCQYMLIILGVANNHARRLPLRRHRRPYPFTSNNDEDDSLDSDEDENDENDDLGSLRDFIDDDEDDDDHGDNEDDDEDSDEGDDTVARSRHQHWWDVDRSSGSSSSSEGTPRPSSHRHRNQPMVLLASNQDGDSDEGGAVSNGQRRRPGRPRESSRDQRPVRPEVQIHTGTGSSAGSPSIQSARSPPPNSSVASDRRWDDSDDDTPTAEGESGPSAASGRRKRARARASPTSIADRSSSTLSLDVRSRGRASTASTFQDSGQSHSLLHVAVAPCRPLTLQGGGIGNPASSMNVRSESLDSDGDVSMDTSALQLVRRGWRADQSF